jgi:cytochrome c-type biogenesis protein CcmH/NrfF
MAIILATWEAEIGRIMVPGQLGQKSLEDPISTEKSWAWWCTPVILVTVGSIK